MVDEVFIRMCREAKEIQELRPKRTYFPITKDKVVVSGVMGDRWYSEERPKTNYVKLTWLPRIEDLQELFRHKNGNPDDYWILKSFLVWFSHLTPTTCPDREVSITQLWLQYVMETIYQKRWTGTAWEPLL